VHLMRAPTALAHSVESLAAMVRGGSAGFRFSVHYNKFARPSFRGLLVDMARAACLRGDVFHVTGDCGYLALALPQRRTVLTILDCATYRRLGGLRRHIYGLLWIRLPVWHSRIVVAISETVRQEVVALSGVSPSKVRVVHCSILPEFFDRAPGSKLDQARIPVLLQVGTTANKNVERLAEALEGVRCRLLLIGRLQPSQSVALARFGVDYEVRERLSVMEIVRCYRECDVVVFASTSEGFGMPVIEGQACGKPVVAADIPALREVSGDAACFVDPLDPASIRRGIRRVLDDEHFRGDLVDRGHRNAERFRAENLCAEYSQIYREMAAW
jgi:glycosyltransferase involved in cell wall biosynthesis